MKKVIEDMIELVLWIQRERGSCEDLGRRNAQTGFLKLPFHSCWRKRQVWGRLVLVPYSEYGCSDSNPAKSTILNKQMNNHNEQYNDSVKRCKFLRKSELSPLLLFFFLSHYNKVPQYQGSKMARILDI